MRKTVWMSLLLLLCSGCTLFAKEPIVTVRDLSAVSLDGAGAGMDLYLTVKNPNPYDVKLLGYSYDLKVLALPLAKGGAREEVRFPARTETDLRIPIKVSFGDLMEVLKRRPDPDRVPYALDAGLDLETPLGHMSMPVHRTGTYAVPEQFRPGSLLKKLGGLFK